MEREWIGGARGVRTHFCVIEVCPIEVPHTQLMCRGHWRLVPRPIQHEIYSLCRKRPGGPAHLAAIARAIKTVQATLDGWKRKCAGHPDSEITGDLPYRDD